MTQTHKFKPKQHLLDTSALIALLQKEPGYKIIESIIANSAISSVNLSEFVAVLSRAEIKDQDIESIIDDLVPQIIPFCDDIAIHAGKLYKTTKSYGLSLGDRACITTGVFYNINIYTADNIWRKLPEKYSKYINVIR